MLEFSEDDVRVINQANDWAQERIRQTGANDIIYQEQPTHVWICLRVAQLLMFLPPVEAGGQTAPDAAHVEALVRRCAPRAYRGSA